MGENPKTDEEPQVEVTSQPDEGLQPEDTPVMDGDDATKVDDVISDADTVNIEADIQGDGFGSIGNELEVDKEAIEKAKEEKKAEEEKKSIVDGPIIAGDLKVEKRKKSYKRSIVLILLLIILGVGGYFFLKPMLEGENKPHHNRAANNNSQQVSSYRMDGNGLSEFDLKFMKLKNNGENLVYSPLSIKYALAMLKDGADGETEEQINNVIGDYEAKKYINSKNLSLANAMFINKQYKGQILDSYIEGLKKSYNAEVAYDSFKDATVVNGWIKKNTLGLISKFMDDNDVKDLNYLLVNALAMDQQWVHQLQCKDLPRCKNKEYHYQLNYKNENVDVPPIWSLGITGYTSMKFGELENRKAVHIGASYNRYDIIKEMGEEKIRAKVTEEYEKWLKTENGQYVIDDYRNNKVDIIDPTDVVANVDAYMKELKANYGKGESSTDFYLYTDDDVKIFAKDLKEYNGTTLQYVGIMPKEKELKSYVEGLTAEKATELIGDLKEVKADSFEDGKVTVVDAYIPVFKYGTTFGLQENLEALGIEDVFSKEKADLSKMTKEKGAHIDTAVHSATIDFDNDGIRASAVTALGGLGGGGLHFDYKLDVPVVKINLSFDKPFLYLIRDKSSGEIWFAGTVYEPPKCEKMCSDQLSF